MEDDTMAEGTPKTTSRLEVSICDGHTPVVMLKPHRWVIDDPDADDCTVEVGFTLDQLRQIARAIRDHFRQLRMFDQVEQLAAELEEEGASPELIEHLLP
jgi:hypothetical protein